MTADLSLSSIHFLRSPCLSTLSSLSTLSVSVYHCPLPILSFLSVSLLSTCISCGFLTLLFLYSLLVCVLSFLSCHFHLSPLLFRLLFLSYLLLYLLSLLLSLFFSLSFVFLSLLMLFQSAIVLKSFHLHF